MLKMLLSILLVVFVMVVFVVVIEVGVMVEMVVNRLFVLVCVNILDSGMVLILYGKVCMILLVFVCFSV